MSTWGGNFYGQFGNGTNTLSLVPINISCPTLKNEEYVNEKLFYLYPNPVNSILNIISNEIEIDKLTIFDLVGKIILNQENNSREIDVQNLASGIYIISVTAAEKTFYQKFVKE